MRGGGDKGHRGRNSYVVQILNIDRTSEIVERVEKRFEKRFR